MCIAAAAPDGPADRFALLTALCKLCERVLCCTGRRAGVHHIEPSQHVLVVDARQGTAYTFITSDQGSYAGDIIRALEMSKSPVPDQLNDLWINFKNERERLGMAKAAAVCVVMPTAGTHFFNTITIAASNSRLWL